MISKWKERVKPITVTGSKSNLICVLQNALITLKKKKGEKKEKERGHRHQKITYYIMRFTIGFFSSQG